MKLQPYDFKSSIALERNIPTSIVYLGYIKSLTKLTFFLSGHVFGRHFLTENGFVKISLMIKLLILYYIRVVYFRNLIFIFNF
ncbi:hypothetical protein GLOIN_2v1545796 [Rhizophagus irregularis DAOM 181602=DAOM 197198]|uniref:Uncharacterized protein n=1 Tax=Rhizophagus irregularis (strain DAOM 181602 / DAOM 197198 / MUCL 43194) TaxID=747089 RepID=A0A2P4QIW8_RHIID|nr:hypothetical protein GLOIN_2v1545796 [Rhizophagus irregularis DAOM 181602=DAOM 197198]POG77585.1 hypothetical protein GLOIN_2v1545796 [Rhizophagus irregularis DAOM 181602=DAOM 197198]GET54454.1 hypothetical protein GLOIN_2v1545796 [Rhizophagus irregularis DAOM 181602=DAOM 197198]|eukprot:XP_025184451.1 hypothetical protein GLOIN_2v1545796 [Rhizophagus irregularis DAOM 181602=DAOM 197198]